MGDTSMNLAEEYFHVDRNAPSSMFMISPEILNQ